MFLGHLFDEQKQRLARILRTEGTSFSFAMTFYCQVYLQQYGKFLEKDLIGTKAANQKQENKRGLNPGPFGPDSSALPSEP